MPLITHYRELNTKGGWVSHDDCTFQELCPHRITDRGWWTGTVNTFRGDREKQAGFKRLKVIEIATGREFPSIMAYADFRGVSRPTASDWIKNGKWIRYADESKQQALFNA